MRRQLVAVVAVLALFVQGSASAYGYVSTSREAAHASMSSALASYGPSFCSNKGGYVSGQIVQETNKYAGIVHCGSGGYYHPDTYEYPSDPATWCEDPSEVWDSATHTCSAPPPTPEECLAMPNLVSVAGHGANAEVCSEGCTFVPDQVENIGIQLGTDPMIWTAASWKASGGTCTVGPSNMPTPLVNDQACADAGNGMTMCIRADGQHCATASTGKQICWRPGETGTKFSEDVAQKRIAGSTAPTAPTPPEGESFVQGASTTATTSKGGSTFTTTTTNFTTVGGTDAGGTELGDGEAADGSGNEGDGTYDNDDGSAAHAGDSIWGADETLSFTADESGLGFGTTCPAPPTLDVLGGVQLDWAGMCEVLTYLGLLILAAAHMHALYILLEA